MSFNSKYSGQQVENLLDQVASGNAGGGGGGITTEIDPIFSASPSAKITDVNIEEWNSKQDVISDLESIRNNASKGAQALDAIPTKVSQLENDEGYLTSHQDISGLATKDELQGKVDKVDGKQLSTEDFTTLLKQKLDGLSNYDDTEISQSISKLRTDLDTLVSGDTTAAIKTFNEVIAFLDGISDTEDLASIIASIEQQIAAKGTYTKPSNGIPKSDLASAVQTSLGKADTALQSVPSEYVTETELNNKGYATSSQLNTGFADAERKFAALNEEMDNKQPILVSGTNIKTINGNSILGSGDIVISGGGGSSEGLSNYPKQNLDIWFSKTITLSANTYYIINVTYGSSSVVLDIYLATPSDTSIVNEYVFQIYLDVNTSISLPDYISWANDDIPIFEEGMMYEISIVNAYAMYSKFQVI